MKWTNKEAVLATIAYAELFSYHLSERELYTWLITDRLLSISSIKKHTPLVGTKFKMLTEKRKRLSSDKWERAKKVSQLLSHIPTIELIGVSGGLAMNNVEEDDDIDLCIMVMPGTIWITRFCVLLLLEWKSIRRKVGNATTKNLICPNMFIDTQFLSLPSSERDLYSAHEVLQMVPVFDRDHTYQRFLQANSWVKNFLYNAWINRSKTNPTSKQPSRFLGVSLYVLNIITKGIQLIKMKPHRTTEVVTDTVLRFHPKDVRTLIRLKYIPLLKEYKVPLDSSFLKSLK